jgi:membrane protein implicated in regulation of membrane protease activity
MAAQTVEQGGLDPGLVALAGTMLSALTTAIAVLWRQSVAESRRKDELIDRLLEQVGRTAEATDRAVSHAERDRRISR